MQLWLEILARELVMLVTLLALGVGPAWLLGRRFDMAARLALAPALGFCVAASVFTTLIWFTAARNTYWLLPLLAVVSVATALLRARTLATEGRGGSGGERQADLRLRWRDAIALVVVIVVVAAPLSYTLHERDSVGPVGFQVWDADGYTSTADAMEEQSIKRVDRPEPANANLALLYWVGISHQESNLDASPLAANLDELIGLHATDTQSPFLIMFLVIGALGAFAAIRYFAPKPWWVAPLAGVLFAGPLFLQLMIDGSQAATCGLAVILPTATIGVETLRQRRLANLALLALLASGLLALYPVFVPSIALSGVIVLAAVAIRGHRRGLLSRPAVARAATQIALVLVLAVALDIVSFTRDLHYWSALLHGKYISMPGLPTFNLPISVLPGWLLQTREFYDLSNLAHAPAGELLLGVLLPAILIAVILAGVRRRPVALVLVLPVCAAAALAEYTSARYQCSYCVDRNLLPVGPLSIALVALGIAAVANAGTRWLRHAAVAIAVVVVIVVAISTLQERTRFASGAYFLEAGSRTLLTHLPPHRGPIYIEGYGEDPGPAPGELPLTYSLVSERNHREVSLAREFSDYESLAYLGGASASDPQLDPNYRFVLTRLGDVQTNRRVIARAGPLALEERTSPLDATIISGIAVPMVRFDQQGLAWVVGPLRLLLLGGGSAPAWIQLRFQTVDPATVLPQAGARQQSTPHQLTVCVQATGTAPVRRASLSMRGTLVDAPLPTEEFALAQPPQGIAVVSMRALTHCSLGGGS